MTFAAFQRTYGGGWSVVNSGEMWDSVMWSVTTALVVDEALGYSKRCKQCLHRTGRPPLFAGAIIEFAIVLGGS
ncbi:hypothetical protein J6590_085461 [Homalodisca vitripennis]|nr:hypothetical protein J6590_085461 [Homalodisca vitripennis]